MNSSNTGKDKKTTSDIAQLAKDVITKHYTQRQWDRTVGIGKVPEEYTEEVIHDKCGTDDCCQKCDTAVPPIVKSED
jgi:hypothetical protein